MASIETVLRLMAGRTVRRRIALISRQPGRSIGWALTLLLCVSGSLPTAQAQVAAASFAIYDCRPESAATVEQMLSGLLKDRDDFDIVVDRGGNRILVRGDAEVQRLAAQLIRQVDRSEAGVATAGPPAEAAATGATGSDHYARFVPLPQDRWNQLQPQLQRLFAVEARQLASGRRIWQVGLGNGRPTLELEYDTNRAALLVGGPAETVNALVRLVQALHSPERSPQRRTAIFRLPRQVHDQVQQIIQASQQPAASAPAATDSGQQRWWPGSTRPTPDPQIRPSGGLASSPAPASAGGVAQVRYLYQESRGEPTPAATGNQEDATEGPDRLPALGALPVPNGQFGDVELETFPELDVIILRGRDQELAELEEIVRRLEMISRQTRPAVTIYDLQHAQSEAVAQIIAQTSDDLIGGRQGRATVIPLVKPNSLLVIGWGEAVETLIDLVRRLDTPVDPASQFQVFRLRFAAAAEIQQTIQAFFSDREPLGPDVRVTIDQRTNSLIAYASPRDMLEVRRLVNELDTASGESVNRARIFQLQHALADDLAATLQQAIDAASNGGRSAILELQLLNAEGRRILQSGTLDNVQITPNPRTNSLLVSTAAENHPLIEELIRQLDTPGSIAQIKVFRIINGDAASLVQTLRSLLPTQTTGAGGVQLPSSSDAGSLAPLRFSVDERSNSIIATGSAGDLKIVEALLVKLDQSTTLQRKTTVYQLRNSPAVDVASAVNQFLLSKRQIESAAPGATSPFQDIEREVVVVPEPIANKLILSATPRYFQEINDLIQRLDEQPPQVMIQVLIAEVALNDTDEFGVELGLQDSVLFDRSLLGDLETTTSTSQTSNPNGVVTVTEQIIQAATNLPGFAFNSIQPLGNSGSTRAVDSADTVGGQGISNFAVGRGNDQLGFGGLVLSASSQNVSVLIRALKESRRVRILSRPQVRTLDNQPAFIQVGQRVPRVTGSTVNQNGQTNTVDLENVGLILGVTPRISPEGTVVMEIDAEKSNIGPEQDGIPVAVSIDGTVIRSPRVDTTTAQATVSAADGETIVLGGLITTVTEETHRQVPLLGDLPLVRHLFRFDSVGSRRSELLIILTPHVIRSPADNQRSLQAEMARMSWCAADVFNIYGDIGALDEPYYDLHGAAEPLTIYPDRNPRAEPPLPSSLPDRQDSPPLDLPDLQLGPALDAAE